MAKSSKQMEATKKLMAALVRMPPKPHEEMKLKRGSHASDKSKNAVDAKK